jgi:hypothetical protein
VSYILARARSLATHGRGADFGRGFGASEGGRLIFSSAFQLA